MDRGTQRRKAAKAQGGFQFLLSLFLLSGLPAVALTQKIAQRRKGAKRRKGCQGLLLLLLLAGFPAIVLSQADTAEVDTVEAKVMPPVTVIGSRLLSDAGSAGQASSLILREQIEATGARDLADAVTFSPGLYVKRYGGLGGLRTLSLRGTASEGTALLIDGVRYRSSAEGGFDLGNIPADAIEGVEIIRGGNAAVLGGNSLGGGINVITNSRSRKPRLRGTLAVGSFGEVSVGVGGSSLIDNHHSIDASFSLTESEGDYPFSFNEFGETAVISRENGQFSNLFGRLGWKFLPEESSWEVGAALQGYWTDRGVPGAVVQGSRERLRAQLEEGDIFGMVRGARSFDRVTLTAAATGRLNRLRYNDPDDRTGGLNGIDNRYDLGNVNVIGRLHWFPDNQMSVGANVELEYIRLQGDNLDPAVADGVERQRVGGLVRGSRIFPNRVEGESLRLDAALRYDLFTDLDPELAPSIGLLWQPFTYPLRLRGHAALNYRAPTFSEQYYLNFGNANLKTEHSRSLSGGAVYQPVEEFTVESTLFLIDTRDRIVAVPRSPVSWSAQNIGSVLSRGVEFGVTGTLFQNLLSGSLSYTLMKTEDRSGGITDGHLIPYAPQELFNGLVTLSKWDFSLTGSWEYVSHRHTLSFNTPESALPHYLLIDIGIAKEIRFRKLEFTGRLNLSNLFNEEYQVVRNYPMPGRSLRVEANVVWGG
ncbi:MAG: TonB-dependent receptor plug domain-containing protein [Candidatus Kapaibacterium sp.]